MINQNRLNHMIGVARRCYQIAKEKGYSEDVCRDFWLMGFLHDIGYEFIDEGSKTPTDHKKIAYDMLIHLVESNSYGFINVAQAIRQTGNIKFTKEDAPIRLQVLNEANMTVDSKGMLCTIKEKLQDIKTRLGKDSIQYANAKLLVEVQELEDPEGLKDEKKEI